MTLSDYYLELGLNANADIDAQTFEGRTPLIYAVRGGFVADAEVVAILLNANADIGIGDANGDTALHHVVMRQWPSEKLSKLLQLLQNAGGDISMPNSAGRTALDLATAKGREEVRKPLQEHLNRNGRYVSSLEIDIDLGMFGLL